MNAQYRISRWCKFFVREDVVALHHSLNLAVVYLNKDVGEYIIAGELHRVTGDILAALLSNKLLVVHDTDEMEELYMLRDRLHREIYLNMMYLLVTDGCNLQCRYCFEETPTVSQSFQACNMDNDTVDRAVTLFAKLTSCYGRKGSKRIVHLYGGEPLLNPSAVYRAIAKVEELKVDGTMPQECEVIVVSNGTLLRDETLQFFSKNDVTVGISLDAPAHINNIHRLAKNAKLDTFAQTRQAYELARERGVKVGLSATLTPEVVAHFDEVLDFFLDDLGIEDGISFNILHYNPALLVDTAYFEKAAQCLIKAFECFRKRGVYEERMMRKVTAFVEQEAMFADCGVVGNQIVVAPDGKIGVCQDFVKPRSYFNGSVFDDNFDPVKNGLFEEWSKRSPLFMEECFDCEAIGMCGGGCPASVELKTGSRWNVDERICPHAKLTLEWLIWDTYHNTVT